jgi:hypothetical protein
VIHLADDRPESYTELRGFYRAFDFSRTNPWPDTLRIRRELDAAQAMHDEAMNGNQDGD